MPRERTRERGYTRRRMLRSTAAVGSIALVAGCGGPEGDDDADLPAEEGTGNGQDQEGNVGAENGDDTSEDEDENGNGNDSDAADNISGDEGEGNDDDSNG